MEINIFKLDNSSIDVLKVITELWRNRKNESLVRGLAETLTSFAVEKRTLHEIEFYLPQIAQLIVHLESSETSASQALEYLAIGLAQSSIHIAMQLCFYFVAALEDYQPELKTGAANPKANIMLFYRAARLLQNVNRAVVFGSPVLTTEQEKYMTQQFSQLTLDEMYETEKSEAATRIVRSNMGKVLKMGASDGVSGRLLYKGTSGTWSQFFFKTDQRVLFCFKDNMANAAPVRALLLEGAEVTVVPNPPQPYMFTVENKAMQMSFSLRASDQNELASWVRFLTAESVRVAIPADGQQLTEGQTKRLLYWVQMRTFVRRLVVVSEQVKQRPVDVRKFFLRKHLSDLLVPPLAYLPGAQSLDRFKYILKALPCESSVASFASSAHVTVLFEMEQHPQSALDVATFLSKELQEYREDSIRAAAPPKPSDLVLDRPASEGDGFVEQPMIPSALVRDTAVQPFWKPDGAGMDGLEERFVSPTTGNRGRESIVPPSSETHGAWQKSSSTSSSSSSSSSSPSSSSSGAGQVCNAYMLRVRDFETFETTGVRVRSMSPAGHLSNWRLGGVTAASGVDARQEALVNQLVAYYGKAFEAAGLPVWLPGRRVTPVCKEASVSEIMSSTHSLASIKAHHTYPGSLAVYFEKAYGGSSDAPQFKRALDNFVGSMAAYSVICYLLGIRGRSDANMFLDPAGHIVHSDFSSVFSAPAVSTPLFMQDAPFPLSADMVAVMHGRFSPAFATYARLCGACLVEARKHLSVVKTILEIYDAQTIISGGKLLSLGEFESRHIPATPDSAVEYEFNFLIEKAREGTK